MMPYSALSRARPNPDLAPEGEKPEAALTASAEVPAAGPPGAGAVAVAAETACATRFPAIFALYFVFLT